MGSLALRLYMARDSEEFDAATALRLQLELFGHAVRQLEATPVDSPDYVIQARYVLNLGYVLASDLIAQQRPTQARDVVASMDKVLEAHSAAAPPPHFTLAFARLLWLKDLLADAGLMEHPPEVDAGILRLTANPDVYRGDYVWLMEMRYRVLWRAHDSRQDESRRQACAVAEQIDRIIIDPENIARRIECELQVAEYARADRDYRTAEARLERARGLGRTDLRDATPNPALALSQVAVEAMAARVAADQNRDGERERRLLAAADAFGGALHGPAASRMSRSQVLDHYSLLRDFDEGSAATTRNLQIQTLEHIAGPADSRPRAVSRSPVAALVGSDALARLAILYRESGDLAAAADRSARAALSFRAVRIPERAAEFDEDMRFECGAYSERINILVELRRIDEAQAAYRDIDERCGAWLRRFPWDFYVRQHGVQAARALGRLLHQEHRYAEAEPFLRFASDWGDRQSSFYLVDLYRHGRVRAADNERADAFAALGRRQWELPVSAPAMFGGDRRASGFTVLEYARGSYCPLEPDPATTTPACIGFEGIDDQAEWLRRARGGVVPDDVVAAMRRANQVARENNASFPELVAYVLDEAEQHPQQTTQNPDAGQESAANTAGEAASPPAAAPARGTAGTAGPAADPRAPITMRLATLVVQEADGDQSRSTETFVFPYRLGTCFNWMILARREQRTVTLREEYDLPGPAPNWGGITDRTVVTDGGRHASTTLDMSLAEGMLSHGWCLSEGDPTGFYRIRVFQGDRLLHQFDFEALQESRPENAPIVG